MCNPSPTVRPATLFDVACVVYIGHDLEMVFQMNYILQFFCATHFTIIYHKLLYLIKGL